MSSDVRVESEVEFDEELRNRQYVCPICGKKFTLPMYVSLSDYTYVVSIYNKKTQKSIRKKCCSYSCYRKGNKE